MTATTTLITFLVRVPSTTKSVSLYGSWDNFRSPYPMTRDSRVGPEHWSGCHHFSDIICDGKLSNGIVSREGGLKMGGTYWYFYKLDDDLEFHNSSEPSTTQCPLLPGQLVNILHVPFAFSNHSHSRSSSSSSTSSQYRTLNPSDKFVNPRPAPRRPIPRLQTSPTFLSDFESTKASEDTSGTRSAYPASPVGDILASTALKAIQKIRMARKPSLDGLKSVSLVNRKHAGSHSTSLRPSLSNRSTSSEDVNSRGRTRAEQMKSPTRNASSPVKQSNYRFPPRKLSEERTESPISQSQNATPNSDLLLRNLIWLKNSSDGALQLGSFAERRARSKSREPSLRSNAESSDGILKSTEPETLGTDFNMLSPVVEVNTPGKPPSKKGVPRFPASREQKKAPNLEKRLPTLPNTPSSAYPPSPRQSVAANSFTLMLKDLQSHFSASTVDTAISVGTEILDSPYGVAATGRDSIERSQTRSSDVRVRDSALVLQVDESCKTPLGTPATYLEDSLLSPPITVITESGMDSVGDACNSAIATAFYRGDFMASSPTTFYQPAMPTSTTFASDLLSPDMTQICDSAASYQSDFEPYQVDLPAMASFGDFVLPSPTLPAGYESLPSPPISHGRFSDSQGVAESSVSSQVTTDANSEGTKLPPSPSFSEKPSRPISLSSNLSADSTKSMGPRDDRLSSAFSSSAIASSPSLSPTLSQFEGLCPSHLEPVSSAKQNNQYSPSIIQHYSLPPNDGYQSTETLKQYPCLPSQEYISAESRPRPLRHASAERTRLIVARNASEDRARFHREVRISHSESMKQLLDELSYLSNMIRR